MNAARELRTPFFVLALMVVLAAVALEVGAAWFLPQQQAQSSAQTQSQLGIPALWLFDVSLLWTLVVMALEKVADKNKVARLQGVATLVISVVVIVLALKALVIALVALLIMVALLSSFFGWLVYLPLFSSFDTGAAATVLGAITLFKLVAAVLLVLAQQRFLQMKGLVLLFALSLVCDLVLSFLHGFPPGILVSVTDAIGAIVVCIVAIVYAVFQAVWAVVAIVRAAV